MRQLESIPDACLADFLTPDKFDTLVKAVLFECRFEAESDKQRASFNVSSLALKLGHSVRKCAALLRGKGLRERNKKQYRLLRDIFRFMTLNGLAETRQYPLV